MEEMIIYICSNGHHFLSNSECPFCSAEPVREVEYREGDCIQCGQLCPVYAYGCSNPAPLDTKVYNK
jgi:hypothetical protein